MESKHRTPNRVIRSILIATTFAAATGPAALARSSSFPDTFGTTIVKSTRIDSSTRTVSGHAVHGPLAHKEKGL